MPSEQNVFFAFAAGVVDQHKCQSVFAHSGALVNAVAIAVFWDRFRAWHRAVVARNEASWHSPGLMNCDDIARNRTSAPDLRVRLRTDKIKCTLRCDRPDSAERIGPSAGKRGRTRSRSSCIGTHKSQQSACENY